MSLTPLDAAYTNISNCFPAADAWTRLPVCLRRAESRQTSSFTSLFGVGGAEGANSFRFIVRSITRTNTSGDTAFDTNMIRFARETGQFDAFTRRLQARERFVTVISCPWQNVDRRSIQTRGVVLPPRLFWFIVTRLKSRARFVTSCSSSSWVMNP